MLKRNAETEESEEEAREKPRVKKRRRSDPRNSFELPTGFTTIKKQTKSKSWKEYLGPDGIH